MAGAGGEAGDWPSELLSQFSAAAMMLGPSAGLAWVVAASFTAGGAEALSVPREAGHVG